MNANAATTIPAIAPAVSGLWDVEGAEDGLGASDGTPVAVTVGTALACEGKRELATADNDCWAACVIDRQKVPSWSVSVPF